jgi:hypothetical protein
VAERGVQSAGVVNLIDEAWKVSGDVFEGFVVHQIDGLAFAKIIGVNDLIDPIRRNSSRKVAAA